jgi:UDP-glucose 4-epimerase
MHILVAGGAGYIGSHACLELLQAGYDMVAAVGQLPRLAVFGNDYFTPDGTGVRDYFMWSISSWDISRPWSNCGRILAW